MATRNFKLIGRTYSEDVACTITLNGAEIFSGTLLQESGDDLPVCVGSAEVGDDSVSVTLPVSITITAGSIEYPAQFGMFQFNYAVIINPLLTPEEAAYIGVPTAEVPAEILTSVKGKGGFYIHSADQYAYGRTPAENQDNRSNVLIDGSPSEDPNWNYQSLSVGQVLTFDQHIFARL